MCKNLFLNLKNFFSHGGYSNSSLLYKFINLQEEESAGCARTISSTFPWQCNSFRGGPPPFFACYAEIARSDYSLP